MGAEPGGGAEWETVKRLLADALEVPREERAAFLDRACGQDAALRAELASLLPDEDTEQDFLARPATELLAVPEPSAGQTLGGYTLGRVIGEGGMGRVYEATQERPQRTVALKVLRPGFLAPDAERRFEWEAEVLARLDHPAVAKVHAAGIELVDGRAPLPWFAMELVEGRPLLEAADALGLDRRGRLELFARVCDGVAHAHQRGVIHRDLKPENILVDAGGAPHVLDFGIARTADPMASSVTTAGAVIGTLAYMSPEQLLGDPDAVDARTDVYALGVLLYRLLTGRAPLELDGLSLPQVALRVERDEPPPAGRVDRALRGDLETILATALARDVERRYASVDRLAADVRRTLADEPITARPPTTLYQLSKFARRHRGLAAGLALSFALLVVAAAGTTAGMLRASRAQARAEAERDRARAAQRLLEAMFESASPDQDGRDVRVVELLDAAGVELAADSGLEPAVRGALHFTLGRTYQQLGLAPEAEGHLARAVALLEETDGRAAELTIEATGAWAEALLRVGEPERSREVGLRLAETVRGLDDPPTWIALRPLELELLRVDARGDRLAHAELARELYQAWVDGAQEGDEDVVDTARNNLAVALLEIGESAEAEALLLESIRARSARLGPEHPRVLTQRINLASSLTELGRAAEGVRQLEELAPLAERTWGPLHELTLSLRNNLASALEGLGRYEESFALSDELLTQHVEIYGAGHPETLVVQNNVAVAAMRLERHALAEELLVAALEALDRDPTHADPIFRARVAGNLASALGALGRRDEALEVSLAALGALASALGEGALQALIARNNHAMLLLEAGRADEAAALGRANLELAERHQPGHPVNSFPFRSNLGRMLSAAGRHAEATAELAAVEAALAADPDAAPNALARCRELLADALDAAGRADEAEAVRARQ